MRGVKGIEWVHAVAGHCNDVRKIVKPVLDKNSGYLYYVNLSFDEYKLGGSSFAQTLNKIGSDSPVIKDPVKFKEQIQETLTAQIAETIQRVLDPLGVAVLIDASHQCMTTRGVHKPESSTVTKRMLGVFKTDENIRSEFMELIR